MSEEEPPALGHAAPGGFVVERADEDDWERVRSVRLAALADSPSAFGSTLAAEREMRESGWRDWCRDTATYLALRDGAPVGIAAGVTGVSRDERTLISMWVHPAHRGTGVSTALLEAVRDWAVRDGATRLVLWVTRTNHAAAALYQRAGFARTGTSKPLPSNPALIEEQRALDLR
ncbi:MAG TPA: GNAT family N-acetyltransferase [Marmoricola sp.]|nr:GNAT family N-acetyltransferase [Marmoricola sp.]